MKKIKQTITKAEITKTINNVIDSIPEGKHAVIKGLEIAKSELLKYDGSCSKQHNGKVWTEDEDEKLCEMFDERYSITEMCEVLGRTERGCAARLRRLGKIESRSEMYEYLEY